MSILGVSGSPIKDSNTDRAVRAILDATGMEYEFVKLSSLSIEPCRACLGCVKTNVCIIQDDGIELAEKLKKADALVVGGFTPYSSLDARTKAFLERMYPLRHNKGFLANKLGASVITTAIPEGAEELPPAADMGANAISFFMLEEGMNCVGSLHIQGNVPCIRCGYGDSCHASGIKMIFGPDAKVDTVGVRALEKQPYALDEARTLGIQLAAALQAQT